MYIGLYSEPTNSEMRNYKGLYRQNELFDYTFSNDSLLKKYVNWFYSLSKEGDYIENTFTNRMKLVEMSKLLHSVESEDKWRPFAVFSLRC